MNPTLRLSFQVAFVAIFTYFITTTVQQLGFFKNPPIHSEFSDCIRIRGINGSEDLQIHEGIVYAAPDPRDLWFFESPLDQRSEEIRMNTGRIRGEQEHRAWNGAIYILDLRKWDPSIIRSQLASHNNNGIDAGLLKKLPILDMPNEEIFFHPHGLSLRPNGDSLQLYVVSHSPLGDGVMIFNVIFDDTHTPTALKLLHIVRHPIMVALNDVVAVPTHSDKLSYAFYASNFGSFPLENSWKNHIEMITQRPWAHVIYCYSENGSPWICEYAITKISYPNGVNLSPDGTQLYVAQTMAGHIAVFTRNPDANTVREQGQVEHQYTINVGLGNGVDNIDVDPLTGDIYIASHPRLYQWLMHANTYKTLSSIEIFRIKGSQLSGTNPTRTWFDSIHYSNGSDISSVATAAYWNHYIVMGPVFIDGLLVCTYQPAP